MITTREQIIERIRMIQRNVREGHSHLWALNGYDQDTVNRIVSDAFREVEKYQKELKAMGLPRVRLPKWI